ncbi:Di-copper centre-containing protein [Xylariaceae sp. FL0016]|nr:Di-copper centre-containing protein [Xylariaceae sp. FL0016]
MMLGVLQNLVSCAAIAACVDQVCGQDQPVPVTGLTTGIDTETGEPPSRMNINTLASQGGPGWDLFIRGLDALQNRAEDDERSHYSIGGIHGMPYNSFNGVSAVPGSVVTGYCPHGETQFVAWHRAYIALYEQTLGEEIQQLASEYTGDNADDYKSAAETFRFPYWDWAGDPSLPNACTQESIIVAGPDGRIELHNPLYDYRWQTYPLNQTDFPGFSNMGPTTTRGGDGGFDPDYVNSNLENATDRIRDSVYRTFVSSTTYDQMASMSNSGSSFEAPHNDIHNLVGGSFPALEVTGFDTLFMLHHCNLDRLSALWMAIHRNNTYQTQTYTSNGLFSTAKGDTITANSPLKPFYQADGTTLHTGMSVNSTEVFGYTYPELSGRLEADGEIKDIIAQVNKLYGGLGGISKAASGPGREWFVDVQVERVDLELPATIEIYLGDQLAGRTVLLRMPMDGLAHDEIPLKRAISALDISETDPDAIEAALEGQLHITVKNVCIFPNLGLPGTFGARPTRKSSSLRAMVMGSCVDHPGPLSARRDTNVLTPIFNRRPMAPYLMGQFRVLRLTLLQKM